MGIFENSNQLSAVKYFRKQLNPILERLQAKLQKQPYDHVLSEEQRNHEAFEAAAEYIARNPERSNLIRPDGFREYAYTDELAPGYPELHFRQPDYWERFWRIYSYLQSHGLYSGILEK